MLHLSVLLIETILLTLKQGADVWLTKPFNKKDVMVCLHNLLVQREILVLKCC